MLIAYCLKTVLRGLSHSFQCAKITKFIHSLKLKRPTVDKMDFLLNDNKVVEFTVNSFKNASLMLFH